MIAPAVASRTPAAAHTITLVLSFIALLKNLIGGWSYIIRRKMLDRVSIAAPCPADWDSMPGTDQVRHCSQCNKNVYNLSAMTRREAEALLREKEGQLCARLYRRADGTILTENCPAGLRAIGRRVSRVAGAAMSAVAALAAAAAGQVSMVWKSRLA